MIKILTLQDLKGGGGEIAAKCSGGSFPPIVHNLSGSPYLHSRWEWRLA